MFESVGGRRGIHTLLSVGGHPSQLPLVGIECWPARDYGGLAEETSVPTSRCQNQIWKERGQNDLWERQVVEGKRRCVSSK
jgi:hypothetical protein